MHVDTQEMLQGISRWSKNKMLSSQYPKGYKFNQKERQEDNTETNKVRQAQRHTKRQRDRERQIERETDTEKQRETDRQTKYKNSPSIGMMKTMRRGYTIPPTSVRIAGGLGVEPPTSSCRPPYLWSKFDPRGSNFNPPSKFFWSWYAAWFTLPYNAVLKISTVWWFECYYYFNSYWRLWVVLSRIVR